MSTETSVIKARDEEAAKVAKPKGPLSGLLTNQTFILCIVLVVMIAFFSALNSKFFSVGVFGNILVDWAPIALIAVGQLFVIVSGGIDLSVGSTLTISGVVAAFAMQGATGSGVSDPVAILIGVVVAVATGAVVGLINAALINLAGLVPFIATLVTLGAGAGMALVLSKGAPIAGGPPSAIALSVPWLGPLSWPGITVILVIVIAGLFLHKARFGRYVFAIGGNAFAAKAVGIGVKKQLTFVYTLSGMLAGLAGMVVYLTLGAGSPSSGAGRELLAIAAVVIGGASLSGGSGTMSGTVLGSLILTTVTSGLIVINIDPNWNQVVVAVIIAIAVALQMLRKSNRRTA
ncbi:MULTISPECIES: ABC transporter permease [unclassified Microbacterium]|uniref:ABC transporter permease n=1 Tax=unclassified Microbacterium TaxID=2609290 RepID=UPI00365A7BE7